MKKVIILSILLLPIISTNQMIAQSFTEIQTNIVGVWGNTVSWGDYDLDSDLDLLVVGLTDTDAVSKIYQNDNGSVLQ